MPVGGWRVKVDASEWSVKMGKKTSFKEEDEAKSKSKEGLEEGWVVL